MESGIIFDIKKFSIHDGPGIRTTVFLKGCPLSCWWCHNPESQRISREKLYAVSRCIGCGECLAVCPENAISQREIGLSRIRRNVCGAEAAWMSVWRMPAKWPDGN